MGNRDSQPSTSSSSAQTVISYEDAKTLLSPAEFQRLEKAWGSSREHMNKEELRALVFCHPRLPAAVLDAIYAKFSQGSNKLTFENLLIALVVMTKVTEELRNEFLSDHPELMHWVESPPTLTTNLQLLHHSFYQVLAGVTHLEESDVEELEKVFPSITDSKLCKLTRQGFQELVRGTIADNLIPGLFQAFDENRDGLIDFVELVCGLSASCRVVAQLWDADGDGYLSAENLQSLYDDLNVRPVDRTIQIDETGRASLTDFVCWANASTGNYVDALIDSILQIGHICLGLRPEKPRTELEIVQAFKDRIPLEAIAEWYVVSADWYGKWVRALMDSEPTAMVPPIDNAYLIVKTKNEWNRIPSLSREGAHLRPGLVEKKDYELVPPVLWTALLRWHGSGRDGVSLPRAVVQNGGRAQIELYPPTILVLRHATGTGGWLQSAFGMCLPYNLMVPDWRDTSMNQGGLRTSVWCTMCVSRTTSISQLLISVCEQLHIRDADAARFWLIETDGKGCRRLLANETETVEKLGVNATAQMLLEQRNDDMTWPEEVHKLRSSGEGIMGIGSSGSGGDNGAASGSDHQSRGVTGLYNLGNTCYMNSAIQCISNAKAFSEYFLDELAVYNSHLNRTNNSKGNIAVEYANLIKEIWSGRKRCINPIKLRDTMSKYGHFFRSGSQHDCQEFLAILLDCLHEDLNRVTVKAYVPLADSDDRPDSEVADEAWQAHTSRETSIVVDLFTGQLRSWVRCVPCGGRSVRFDAFSCLQLPIPVEQLILLSVVVVKRDGHIPTRYSFRVLSHMRIGQFRSEIAVKSGLDQELFIILCLNRNGQLMAECTPAVDDLDSSVSCYPQDALLYAFELPQIENEENKAENGRIPRAAGTILAAHRKMQYVDIYFLSGGSGCHPVLFGVPLAVKFVKGVTTGEDLYEEVWDQVSRLVSHRNSSAGTAASNSGANRAIDAGEDRRNGYPFDLTMVDDKFDWCSQCNWSRFCRGCIIRQDKEIISERLQRIAVDWKPAALYLKYQHSVELLCIDDESVSTAWDIHYRPLSLQSCLINFSNVEKLDAAVYCKKCKANTPAEKTLDIWRLPKILIIHLKRFVFLEKENKWVKSCKVIDFPLTNFDPSEFAGSNENRAGGKYDCFAMANHYGAMGAGHYVAYAKNHDKWYLFNDSRCKPIVNEQLIDKRSAYLLFYERRDDT